MRFFYTALLCFLFSTLFAQETIEPKREKQKRNIEHDLGFNATFLINQFLNFNGSELAETPYIFIYKLRFEKLGIRAAIGGDLNKGKTENDGFDDFVESNFYQIDSRIGVEYFKSFGKKWRGHFGVDAVHTFSETESIKNSGFDEITSRLQINGFGGGPIMGLSFLINDKLSLNTEGAFYYMFSEERLANLFSNTPIADDAIQDTTRQSVSLTLPASVFLVFTF